MDVGGHIVGGERVVDRLRQLGAGFADVEVDEERGLVEAVEVFVEKRDMTVIEPEPLPNAISEHEAAVVDRDLRLIAVDDFTINVDQDVIVPVVGRSIVGGDMIDHRASFLCER